MNIEISTETLKILGISADDYLYLFLLQKKAYDILKTLDLKPDLESLQTKGYIKLGQEPSDHVIRELFLGHLNTPFLQMWSELLTSFPIKVSSDRGVRILRAADSMARANEKSRLKYEKYIGGNKGKHAEVVKALKAEVDIRRQSNQLQYMQQLSTWINNYSWEKYLNIESTADDGSSRITRQL